MKQYITMCCNGAGLFFQVGTELPPSLPYCCFGNQPAGTTVNTGTQHGVHRNHHTAPAGAMMR